MSKVLCIGDQHAPATHPGYLAFCRDLHSRFNCNAVVHIGDVADFHSISRHETAPEADGPEAEFNLAYDQIQEWHKAFPDAKVCEGNHDKRLYAQAATVNIPGRFLKGYKELWDTSTWDWKPEHIVDDVYYFHGTGCGGMYPAPNTMQKMLMSVVMGHVHSAGGIWWRANPIRRIFGMNTGCGVDDKHIAFRYGENLKVRSILSAGVVLDGVPQHIIMPIGRGEAYHRSRFTKGKKK